MFVFFDTEFSGFTEPSLLSIGLVSESGDESYVELDMASDLGRLRHATANEYVHATVLSQWRHVPDAACRDDDEIGQRVGNWLLDLARRDGTVELVYDDKIDADLLETALQKAGMWSALQHHMQWSIASYLREQRVVDDAMAASWAHSLSHDGLERHHALADARALRAGFVAMHGTGAPPPRGDSH